MALGADVLAILCYELMHEGTCARECGYVWVRTFVYMDVRNGGSCLLFLGVERSLCEVARLVGRVSRFARSRRSLLLWASLFQWGCGVRDGSDVPCWLGSFKPLKGQILDSKQPKTSNA